MVAPSGVDALPLLEQAAVFGGIFVGLGASTAVATNVVDKASAKFAWFRGWQKTWIALGAIYAVIGVSHFLVPETFEAIVPPVGTWGFWALPGTPGFHVAWSGAAEIAGGLGLLGGGLAESFRPEAASTLRKTAAFCLFLLTIAVTPANIYMYTHGAIMPGAGPEGPLDLSFHYVRFLMQVLLLTILYSEARRGSSTSSSSSSD